MIHNITSVNMQVSESRPQAFFVIVDFLLRCDTDFYPTFKDTIPIIIAI
jgi:hypothetical protein